MLSGLKSEFGLKKVKLLGKTIANGCIYPGASKTAALDKIKRPSTVAELRSLYGIISYFRTFVKSFAKVCKPITNKLAKKDGPVEWTADCEHCFQKIVKSIKTGGLMIARYDIPFIVYSDFSYYGLGAVLI